MSIKFYIQITIAAIATLLFFLKAITIGECLIMQMVGLAIGLQDHNTNEE